MICTECGQTYGNNEQLTSSLDDRITQGNTLAGSGYCISCFNHLNDDDFYNIINLKYNLHENTISHIQNCNFNPFSLNNDSDIHANNNIDPDSNNLLKHIYEDSCKYYLEQNFNELVQQNNLSSELSLIHLNIRSLKNKHDELCNYLASLHLTFSIIGLTETWLTDGCDDIYDISTHSLITKNRKNKTGGGVGIYVAKYINFIRREELSIFKEGVFESICIELQLNSKNKILIGVIYRPPNNKITDFEEIFEDYLLRINRENKLCYLMGDFNIDALKIGQNDVSDSFVNQLLSSSFHPLITRPTRITQSSATLIDNILTNKFEHNNVNGVLFTDLSDHLPVFTIEKNSKCYKKKTAIMSRNTKDENIDRLIDKLGKITWEELHHSWDPNICYDIFYDKLYKMYDECIPKKKISNKQLKLQKNLG